MAVTFVSLTIASPPFADGGEDNPDVLLRQRSPHRRGLRISLVDVKSHCERPRLSQPEHLPATIQDDPKNARP